VSRRTILRPLGRNFPPDIRNFPDRPEGWFELASLWSLPALELHDYNSESSGEREMGRGLHSTFVPHPALVCLAGSPGLARRSRPAWSERPREAVIRRRREHSTDRANAPGVFRLKRSSRQVPATRVDRLSTGLPETYSGASSPFNSASVSVASRG
jgi:hypothetical protein